MGLNSKIVLGISVTTDTKKTILEYVKKYLEEASSVKRQASRKVEKPLVIVTPNPEQIVEAQGDPHFAQILNQADVAIPDGVGLLWASRTVDSSQLTVHSNKIKKRIPGVELMEDLVKMAGKEGYTIGLIGGRGGVAVKALECLKRKYPGLRGWTFEPGEIDLNNLGDLGDLGEKIIKTNTRLVFVGLGAPKQEYFIERVKYQVSSIKQEKTTSKNLTLDTLTLDTPLILMSVGGSFDIIAGRTPRAPHAMQAVHLEWFWRLVREPWRWKRQVALIKFLWLVNREK